MVVVLAEITLYRSTYAAAYYKGLVVIRIEIHSRDNVYVAHAYKSYAG